jgi:hypothetical protein
LSEMIFSDDVECVIKFKHVTHFQLAVMCVSEPSSIYLDVEIYVDNYTFFKKINLN